MIKTARILGRVIVSGSEYELQQVEATQGTFLTRGNSLVRLAKDDRLVVLPVGSHIHRNPRKRVTVFRCEKCKENRNAEYRGHVKVDGKDYCGLCAPKPARHDKVGVVDYGE